MADRGSGQKGCIVGYHSLLEAAQAARPLAKVFVASHKRGARCKVLLTLLLERGVPVQRVPVAKLQRLTRQEHHGYVGLSSPVSFQAIENIVPRVFEQGQWPFIVIAGHITDVGNLGAMVRTAEAVGVHAVVLPTSGGACVQEDMVKASSGAIHHVPICRVRSLSDTLRYLRASGLKIVACSEKGASLYHKVCLEGPLGVIMGSEDRGISPALLALAHEQVRLPMLGSVGSLNVSVAFGVLAYEVVRQHAKAQ